MKERLSVPGAWLLLRCLCWCNKPTCRPSAVVSLPFPACHPNCGPRNCAVGSNSTWWNVYASSRNPVNLPDCSFG